MAITKSPVFEVGFSVQNTQSAAISIRDVADIHRLFDEEYPLFQQADLVPRLIIAQTEADLEAPLQTAFGPIPRLWFVTEDSQRLIQFQADRISCNWRRLAPPTFPADYPGYEALRAHFFRAYSTLSRWLAVNDAGGGEPEIGELFYVNTIPMRSAGQQRRISEILSFYQPEVSQLVFGFNVNWVERLPPEASPGTFAVAVKAGSAFDGERAMFVNLVARFSLEGLKGPEAIAHRFDVVHDYIHASLPRILTAAVREDFR